MSSTNPGASTPPVAISTEQTCELLLPDPDQFDARGSFGVCWQNRISPRLDQFFRVWELACREAPPTVPLRANDCLIAGAWLRNWLIRSFHPPIAAPTAEDLRALLVAGRRLESLFPDTITRLPVNVSFHVFDRSIRGPVRLVDRENLLVHTQGRLRHLAPIECFTLSRFIEVWNCHATEPQSLWAWLSWIAIDDRHCYPEQHEPAGRWAGMGFRVGYRETILEALQRGMGSIDGPEFPTGLQSLPFPDALDLVDNWLRRRAGTALPSTSAAAAEQLQHKEPTLPDPEFIANLANKLTFKQKEVLQTMYEFAIDSNSRAESEKNIRIKMVGVGGEPKNIGSRCDHLKLLKLVASTGAGRDGGMYLTQLGKAVGDYLFTQAKYGCRLPKKTSLS